MVLEFYYDLLSQPCRAVYFLLKLGKVDFKGQAVELVKGEHLTKEHIAKNPYHKLPFIKDGDFPLSESAAIMRYIVKTRKLSSQWFPTSDKVTEARVDEFLCWQGSTLRANCIIVFQGMFRDKVDYHWFSKQPMDADKVTNAKDEVLRCVDYMDKHFLKGKQFIGGSKMSAADIVGACELNQLYVVGELDDIFKKYPKVGEWFDRVKKAIGEEWKTGNAVLESIRELYLKETGSAKK